MHARDSSASPDDAVKYMQCMEVWGGNRIVDSGVVMPGLDAWVYSRPVNDDDGGGDVHYVSSCAAGMFVRMLVADVAGHGKPVAETAAHLRKLMRRYINHHDQTRFIRAVNQEFTTVTPAGRFATAVALTFNATNNRLLVANAGHPPPLWHRARSKTWDFLVCAGAETDANFPLGVEGSADYQQFDADLRVGDVVMCYTDSLIEARRPDGTMLEPSGLLRLARSLDVRDPSQIVPTLLSAIYREMGSESLTDDLTLLLFRPNGLRQHVPLSDRLLAPLRVIRSIAQSYLP
jgi:phosphoserine phosphatase RsbU/P